MKELQFCKTPFCSHTKKSRLGFFFFLNHSDCWIESGFPKKQLRKLGGGVKTGNLSYSAARSLTGF